MKHLLSHLSPDSKADLQHPTLHSTACATWALAAPRHDSLFPAPAPPQLQHQLQAPGPTSTRTLSHPVTVGLRFTPTSDGSLHAIRFYRSHVEGQGSVEGEVRGHRGRVYSLPDGRLLGTTRFTHAQACVGGGWVGLPLEASLNVSRGREYVALVEGVHHWAATFGYFASEGKGKGRGSRRGGLAVGPRAGYMGPADGLRIGGGEDGFVDDNFWVDGELDKDV